MAKFGNIIACITKHCDASIGKHTTRINDADALGAEVIEDVPKMEIAMPHGDVIK